MSASTVQQSHHAPRRAVGVLVVVLGLLGATTPAALAGATPQLITFTSAAPTDAVVGGPTYAPSATADSGLSVTLSIDGNLSGICTLSGGFVSLNGPGMCTVTADQAGDDIYAPAQATQSFSVAAALLPQAITFTSTAPSAAVIGGATYAVTATGGGSPNPVTFAIDAAASSVCSIAASIVSFIGAGMCVINANQAGDATYAAATPVTQSFVVGVTSGPPPAGLPTLTVTADAKSRAFGQGNPPLTATFSGFTNGQTLATSGVTGSPACVTTASIASPAGTYPIICSIGTLASAAYTFVFAPGTLTVVRSASSVALSTITTVFETSTPAAFMVAVEPSVTGAIPSGSLVFTIDGVARPAVPLDPVGQGSLTVTWTTPGTKSVEVAYAGDGNVAAPGTASVAPMVVVNTARATGVGVTGSTFYPIVDRWRDTVTAHGNRSERLALAIEVRNGLGAVVRRYAARPGTGPYEWAWDGKTSRGVLALAGPYTIVQTLIDPYGSRPRRTVASTVTLSLRKVHWTAATITVSRGPRCFQFSTGDGMGSYSCSSTAPLRLAGNAGGWPGVGYQFRLPAAGAYRSIRFEILGTATGHRPTISFQDWTLGSAWGQLYRSGWARSAVSPTAAQWASVTKVDLGPVVAARSVRVYVDGGGRLASPFAFDLAGARLVISVGTFE